MGCRYQPKGRRKRQPVTLAKIAASPRNFITITRAWLEILLRFKKKPASLTFAPEGRAGEQPSACPSRSLRGTPSKRSRLRLRNTTCPSASASGSACSASRKPVKQQFYVSSDADADRCNESYLSGQAISISGTGILSGQVRTYMGVVISVNHQLSEPLSRRWLIGIETD
jgi:hypothetical protein